MAICSPQLRQGHGFVVGLAMGGAGPSRLWSVDCERAGKGEGEESWRKEEEEMRKEKRRGK